MLSNKIYQRIGFAVVLLAFLATPFLLFSSKGYGEVSYYREPSVGDINADGGDFTETVGNTGVSVSIPQDAYPFNRSLHILRGDFWHGPFEGLECIGNALLLVTNHEDSYGERHKLANDQSMRIGIGLNRSQMADLGAMESELIVVSAGRNGDDPITHEAVEIVDDTFFFDTHYEGTFVVLWRDPANPASRLDFVSPGVASTAAGEMITIRGNAFANPLEVRIGGVLAPMAHAEYGDRLEVELPAGVAGPALIEVTSGLGTATIAGFSRVDP